ncbi:hypothetical protein LSUE1_G007422 [Lachnellula suecica]|uniref:Uncharacterized protein n=1 Tax=Lachnellula suecica TaxID=602035 RepID=A0A8T9BZ11_9HELO|nr:hypothetical protein LSUE1_G007422 [Lachnellula suecica]
MAQLQEPVLKLVIAPRFQSGPHDLSLHILLCIESPNFKQGSTVLAPTCVFRTSGIEISNVHVLDGKGPLHISRVGGSWIASRDTASDVQFSYIVSFAQNANPVPEKPSIYLDASGEGLLGSGLSFVYIPPGNTIYRNIVEWNFSKAPKETRAVWTFGEGPGPIVKVGPASTLSDSVYMVGHIRSNPEAQIPGSISEYYGYYWFGDVPPNISIIKDLHHEFFTKVSEFFNDPPSKSNPYRSFLRNNGSTKRMGGTSFRRSHIFDYDDKIAQLTDYELIRHTSREMVDIWLGSSVTEDRIDWLSEGMNNNLSVYFPFRFKFRTPHYFASTISMFLTRYYANPLIKLSLAELLELVPTNFYAEQLLGARAFVFAIGIDAEARYMGDVFRPLEDLAIKPLARKKRSGEPYGIEDFLELLRPLMGEKGREMYEEMCSESIMLLPVDRFFGPKTHRLMPIDQAILDFGMNVDSFDNGAVGGLKSGSRAEKAGFKEGDKITSSSHLQPCVDNFDAEMEVIIRRDGEDKTLKYWPRSFDKAKSWKFVKLDEAS